MLLNSTPQPRETPALPSEYQWPSALIPGTCFQSGIIVGSNFSKLLLCLVNSYKSRRTHGFKVNALCTPRLKPVSVNLSV